MTLLKFEDIPINECGEPLVDLSGYDFILEPMYFNQGLSTDSRMFLRKSVADKLLEVQKELGEYKFKIWDAFRSRSVQRMIYEKFWKELKGTHPDWDEERLNKEVGTFVTMPDNPQRVPPHATGAAVDITLVYKRESVELDMGTTFDYFGHESSSMYFEENLKNELAKNNRRILREAMLAAGFAPDIEEWWHFDYKNQKWVAELGKDEAIYGEAETS